MTTRTEIQSIAEYETKQVLLEQPENLGIDKVRTIAFTVKTKLKHRRGKYSGNALLFTVEDNKRSLELSTGIDLGPGETSSFDTVLAKCDINTGSPEAKNIFAPFRGVVSPDAVATCASDQIDTAQRLELENGLKHTKNTYTLTTAASSRNDTNALNRKAHIEEIRQAICASSGVNDCQWFTIEKQSYPYEDISAYLTRRWSAKTPLYGYLFNVHGDPAKTWLKRTEDMLANTMSERYFEKKVAKFEGHKLISNLPLLFKQLYVLWQAERTEACGIIQESYIYMNAKKNGTPSLQALPVPFDQSIRQEQAEHVKSAWPTHMYHTLFILGSILDKLILSCKLTPGERQVYDNLRLGVTQLTLYWQKCLAPVTAESINKVFKASIALLDGDAVKPLIEKFAKTCPRRPEKAPLMEIRRSQVARARPLQVAAFRNTNPSNKNTKAYTTPGTTVTTKTVTVTNGPPNQGQRRRRSGRRGDKCRSAGCDSAGCSPGRRSGRQGDNCRSPGSDGKYSSPRRIPVGVRRP